jgi:hypothetical protein
MGSRKKRVTAAEKKQRKALQPNLAQKKLNTGNSVAAKRNERQEMPLAPSDSEWLD